MTKADGYLATNIIGESVYNGTGDNAENIGDVNDIVLGKDGKSEAVVIGVGGFLGIGEKNVAIDLRQADWAEANGDRWLVTMRPRSSSRRCRHSTARLMIRRRPRCRERHRRDSAPATTAPADGTGRRRRPG